MLRDSLQQRAQFDDAAALRPRRVHRTQVDAEDAGAVDRQLDLEERMARDPRTVPAKALDFLPAQESKRLAAARPPLLHVTVVREALDHRRIGGFLQDDDVGIAGADDAGERLFPPFAAVLDVVAQDSSEHSSLSISTKYG